MVATVANSLAVVAMATTVATVATQVGTSVSRAMAAMRQWPAQVLCVLVVTVVAQVATARVDVAVIQPRVASAATEVTAASFGAMADSVAMVATVCLARARVVAAAMAVSVEVWPATAAQAAQVAKAA